MYGLDFEVNTIPLYPLSAGSFIITPTSIDNLDPDFKSINSSFNGINVSGILRYLNQPSSFQILCYKDVQ